MTRSPVAARLRGARCVVASVAVLGVCTAWQRAVWAEVGPSSSGGDVSSAESAQAPVVEVRVVGSEDSVVQLRNVLGNRTFGGSPLFWSRVDHFAPQQLLDLVPLSRVKIRCWIDLTDPETAKLYFVAPKHDRFMVRELELMQRFGSFEAESIAQIVELSAQALLRDAEAGMSRREVTDALAVHSPSGRAAERPAEAAPPAQAPARGGVGFGVRPTYGIAQYSRKIPLQQGPGIGLYLFVLHALRRDQLEASVSYALPSRVQHPIANAELDRLELRIGALSAWPLERSRRFFLGPEFNLVLGSVGARALAGDAGGTYQLERSKRDLEYGAGIGARLSSRWTPQLGMDVSLGLQYVPAPVRHEILVDASPQELTMGQKIRLGLTLGLRIE